MSSEEPTPQPPSIEVDGEAGAAASSPANKPTPTSARARAEARRRRILEKSKDRMSVVSGAVHKADTTTSTDAAAAADDVPGNENESENIVTDGKEEGTTGNSATETAAAATGSSTSKGSARLAQMRRRRYKKAAAAATPSDADQISTENVSESAEEKVEKVGDQPSEPTETKGKGEENKEPIEKRKYQGVVKMRRKMIAEKKASEAQAASENTTTSGTSTTKNTKASKNGKKDKGLVSIRPIIVQFMTVMLLFLAGFDIGLQNHVVVNQDVPMLHTNYALSDHGIGVLKLVGIGESPSQPFNTIDVEEDEFFDVSDEDEFDGVKPSGAATTPKKEPNIDPVFRVDFDEIIAGFGDGIFLTLVKMAVSVHRMLTYFFLTMPLAFISGLFTLPGRTFVNPPILFLCAVSIRFLGKHVLGGALPDLDKMIEAEKNESDPMKGKEKKTIANMDLISMGTNFVKDFFKTNFPKLVLCYTIFNDARSDMFVVFCGFFLGLVVPSNLLLHEASTSVSEEL